MDIASVMTALTAIQEELTIDSPVDKSIRKAWDCAPPLAVKIGPTDTPVFINEWTLDREDRVTNGVREQYYSVHSMLLVYDADYNRASQICGGFMAAFVDALDATKSLNGTCTWSTLRGANPTLVSVRRGRAGPVFAGLDLYVDVRLTEGKSFGD